MKKILFLAVAVSVAACNSGNTSKEQTTAPADSAKSDSTSVPKMMKEAPPYDASAINSEASVTMITLKARGNTMSEMSFDQTELRVKEGTTVMLTLMNEGKDVSMQHNFVLIQKGTADKVAAEGLKIGNDHYFTPQIPEVLISTGMVGPGKSDAVTFPAPSMGEYEFICTYPGHYTKMRGKLIVEPAAI
jgi:azurin